MEVTHNHNAKSQLAKLLATENITVQHSASAKTAWFDVKNRILMLPIWKEMSEDLYDMLVVHEVGHALDTPGADFADQIKAIGARLGQTSMRALAAIKGFVNVIEDARIDKRQKRRFPGARRNYIKGYQELIDRDFFGTSTKDVNSMAFIDRLNIYCKGGAMLGIKFTAEEKAMLRRVEDAETFEEVLALSEEIYRWSKEQMEDMPEGDEPKKAKGKSEESDEDSDDYEFGESDDETEEDDDGTPSSGYSDDSDDEDSDENEDERNGSASTEKDEDEDEDDNGAGSTQDNVPESETDSAWQKKSEDLVLDSEYDYVYTKLPKIAQYDNMVHDYKIVLAEQRRELTASRWDQEWLAEIRKELVQFKNSENSALSFMVKEFEMRKSADEYSRTSTAKTGMLDTNKLHSYRYNDDLFRRITTVATGKNHGFVMFVDWSGSMEQNLRKTVRQLLSLVMFCKRVQIPFEVYSFRSVNSIDLNKSPAAGMFTSFNGEMEINRFVARNLLSSRMKIQELNDAMYHLFIMANRGYMSCDGLTSTPLNPCIVAASEIVNRFKAKSKVQVVNTVFLTDGDSDCISGSVYGLAHTSAKSRKYIIQDDITKKSYELPARRWSNMASDNHVITPIFLKILKERTGCNLIGFFINSNGFSRVYERYHGRASADHIAKAKKCWSDNGFFGVTSAGYDEYYIINDKNFDVSSGKLEIETNASNRRIATAFAKFSEKKTVSRVLLSQIVKRIAA
jgi:hypothetical protein